MQLMLQLVVENSNYTGKDSQLIGDKLIMHGRFRHDRPRSFKCSRKCWIGYSNVGVHNLSAEQSDGVCNFILRKEPLAALPNGLGTLFQLIPGFLSSLNVSVHVITA